MSYQLTTMVVLFLLPGVQCWRNTLDDPLHVDCYTYSFVNYVGSIFNRQTRDRYFGITCQGTPIAGRPNCYWTGYQNNFRQKFMYRCPNNHYFGGIYSYHLDAQEDRRWKYKCCHNPGVKLVRCYETLYLNNFQQEMKYMVPTGKVMTGWGGVYSVPYCDRRFKVEVCVMVLA
ncbi:hypothetical protein V1264_017630 [Littorina saxatilis]|uniref:Dermatopontin n=1 Tax=Littorina saxatilis TaxID=31220 RepID=A0AAN9BIS6_9CAEN